MLLMPGDLAVLLVDRLRRGSADLPADWEPESGIEVDGTIEIAEKINP
jgi:hypothetical protein